MISMHNKMDIQENIVNKVAQSALVSLDLADLYPAGERFFYDIKDNLFHGLMLKEKDFREFIKGHNWDSYTDKHIAIGCSADAIVPTWAYMLLANKAVAKHINEKMNNYSFIYRVHDIPDKEKISDLKNIIKKYKYSIKGGIRSECTRF